MGGGSLSIIGALLPTIKSEPPEGSTAPTDAAPPSAVVVSDEAVDDDDDDDVGGDILCPICMEIIRNAFLTACGHSSCYMCIMTHLLDKSDCPCCGNYLNTNNIFPNLLLNKLLKKIHAHRLAMTATPVENLQCAFQEGCKVSVKKVDSHLTLLSNKKRRMGQEEAPMNTLILLDFLHCLQKKKLEELNEVQTDLQYIEEDITAAERQRIDLTVGKDKYSIMLRMMDNLGSLKLSSTLVEKHRNAMTSNVQNQDFTGSNYLYNTKVEGTGLAFSQGLQRRDACSGLESQIISQQGLSVAWKKRVHAQFNDLQECYLKKRHQWTSKLQKLEEGSQNLLSRDALHPCLKEFQSVLDTFTQYSQLRVIAKLRHGDQFHSANIVTSIEFDRDDELFATAGVSRRIKVFEFSSVMNEPAEMQNPIVEMASQSKLCCISWNKYIKDQIASSDYDGRVTVWDVTTHQTITEYEEHEKRAWSVDFSHTEPSVLVSGSDDGKVKIWCVNQEASVMHITVKANVCSVKYNPGSSYHVAVGSADHQIRYYDLRNIRQPLHIFTGHQKSVSYVKFLSNNELASASTDSTVRMWDAKDNVPLRTFRGHTNKRNFVGFAVNKDYIACGSETNEVFVYHKAISAPAAQHRFTSSNIDGNDEDVSSYFISAVCWKSDSPTMLAANSRGIVEVLVLAA